jgi:hypothetical protein
VTVAGGKALHRTCIVSDSHFRPETGHMPRTNVQDGPVGLLRRPFVALSCGHEQGE